MCGQCFDLISAYVISFFFGSCWSQFKVFILFIHFKVSNIIAAFFCNVEGHEWLTLFAQSSQCHLALDFSTAKDSNIFFSSNAWLVNEVRLLQIE